MFDFESYHRATGIADAAALLAEHPQSRLLAGGTDVLIRVREGKDAGRSVVSIHNLPELKGVKLLENGEYLTRNAYEVSAFTLEAPDAAPDFSTTPIDARLEFERLHAQNAAENAPAQK